MIKATNRILGAMIGNRTASNRYRKMDEAVLPRAGKRPGRSLVLAEGNQGVLQEKNRRRYGWR